jgi:hypothetical protein
MVVKGKGAGNLQIFKLINGITLDPTQDGNDVVISMNSTDNTTREQYNNQIVEAFGKRWLLHESWIRERDQGGDGNWGTIYQLQGGDTFSRSGTGLHLITVNGTRYLACGYTKATTFGNIKIAYSANGTSWTEVSLGSVGTGGDMSGRSWAVGSSIFSIGGYMDVSRPQICKFDFSTLTGLSWTPSAVGTGGNTALGNSDMLSHKDSAFIVFPSNNTTAAMRIRRLDGTTWINPMSGGADITGLQTSNTCRSALLSDGDDLICLYGSTQSPFTPQAIRISNIATGTAGTQTDVTTTLMSSFPTSNVAGFSKYLDTTDPLNPQWYVWFNQGDNNTGTFDCYQYHWRRIDYTGLSGSFTAGETVTGGTSGATGRIVDVTGGYIGITDVDESGGAFQNTEVLTTTGGSATSASVLTEIAMSFIGTGISAASFYIPNDGSGGGSRIPALPAARPEFDGLPEEVVGGRKRYFRVYGTDSDLTLSQYHNADQGAPMTLSTLVPGVAAIEDSIDVTGLVGNAAETILEGLSPASGDSYVVSATDGDSTLNPGSLAIAVGDIVQWNGSAWVQAVANASNFPPSQTHATLSSTTALISPYTDGVDDGKTASFDGTTLDGIVLTAPSNTTTQITVTPDNGATQYSYRHNSSADGLLAGDTHSVILDVV